MRINPDPWERHRFLRDSLFICELIYWDRAPVTQPVPTSNPTLRFQSPKWSWSYRDVSLCPAAVLLTSTAPCKRLTTSQHCYSGNQISTRVLSGSIPYSNHIKHRGLFLWEVVNTWEIWVVFVKMKKEHENETAYVKSWLLTSACLKAKL